MILKVVRLDLSIKEAIHVRTPIPAIGGLGTPTRSHSTVSPPCSTLSAIEIRYPGLDRVAGCGCTCCYNVTRGLGAEPQPPCADV